MKKILSFVIALVIGFLSFSGAASATEEKMEFGIEAAMANYDSVVDYLNAHLNSIIEDIEQNGDVLGYDRYDPSNIFISEAFQIYYKDETGNYSDTTSPILYFPVISDSRVLFLIEVYTDDEGIISYSESNWLVSELSQFCGSNVCRRVYATHPSDGSAPEVEFTETGRSNSSGVCINLSNLVGEAVIHSAFADNNTRSDTERSESVRNYSSMYITSYCPTNGFSVNTDTEKRLDMSYCLVSDSCINYPCAIPAIATIYRYRTATYSLACYELTQVNNERPTPFDVHYTWAQMGLLNYIMNVPSVNQYMTTSGVLPHVYVQHNINNAFPVLIGGTNSDGDVHAFVIEGYKMVGSLMKWYVYNPWGYTTVTPVYQSGAPVGFSSGNYWWVQGGGSCLLVP